MIYLFKTLQYKFVILFQGCKVHLRVVLFFQAKLQAHYRLIYRLIFCFKHHHNAKILYIQLIAIQTIL